VTGRCTLRGAFRGGHDGHKCRHWKVNANGQAEELPSVAVVTLNKGEMVKGNQAGGGGYGDPLERDPQRVLHDVLERYETRERAEAVYCVLLVEDEHGQMTVDAEGTRRLRAGQTVRQ
jgi:N-methylhydantoinase B